VAFETIQDLAVSASDRADERVAEEDVRRTSEAASRVVRETLGSWPDEDAVILRFRYGSGMSIADIARMLRLPQRPLYRRIEAMLRALRTALDEAGLDEKELLSVIGDASQEMNFGLDERKGAAALPSFQTNPAASGEDWS